MILWLAGKKVILGKLHNSRIGLLVMFLVTYIFNLAAIKTLDSSVTFDRFFKPIWQGLEAGQSFLEVNPFFEKL